jgi:hypothetical protein
MDWDGVACSSPLRSMALRAPRGVRRAEQPTIARRLAEFETTFSGQPCSTGAEGALNAAGERLSRRLKGPSKPC